jgi:hypothetical protein
MSNHSLISCRPVLRIYFQDNEIKSYPDASGNTAKIVNEFHGGYDLDWVVEVSPEGIEMGRWNVCMLAGIEWQP